LGLVQPSWICSSLWRQRVSFSWIDATVAVQMKGLGFPKPVEAPTPEPTSKPVTMSNKEFRPLETACGSPTQRRPTASGKETAEIRTLEAKRRHEKEAAYDGNS
jgi:hypothetical protein